MSDFDMPKTGTWEQRGGWVVRQLTQYVGLSPEQAAGLVGNLGYESNGFASLQEIAPVVSGSAGGYGWAQWTGPRRRAFEAWSAQARLGINTDEANYRFLIHELATNYSQFLAQLRQMQSIEDACHLAHTYYERPQDVLDGSYRSGPDRLKWARRALSGAQGAMTPQPANDPPLTAVTPQDTIRRVQEAIGTASDGQFGPHSLDKLNETLRAAGQRQLEFVRGASDA